MGATESKLAFRKSVFQIYEQKNVPATNESFWSNFYTLPDTAEDVFNLFGAKDIRRVRDTAPANLETLLSKITSRLFAFLTLSTFPTRDDTRAVLNCIRILTRILPYIFEHDDQTLEERLFWAPSTEEDEIPLGTRLARAVIKLLFFRGFTLPVGTESVGVQYLIWEQGVGSSITPPVGRDETNNRIETMRLLMTLLSRSMYCPPPEVLNFENRWAKAILTGLEKKAALALLCSLLNTVVNYDPVGWAVLPYNHLLFANAEEHLVTLCLQALVVLLDIRPPGVDLSQLLTNPLESANTYLPGSTKRANIHVEVLLCFWKLMEHNEGFAHQIMESDKILLVLASIIYFLVEARTDPAQAGLVRLCSFLLHIISQSRTFGVQLNAAFDHSLVGAAAKCVPTFTSGTWADFFFLAIHTLTTTPGQTVLNRESLLVAMTNVSPYAKSLNPTTSTKLLSLFSMFSNPAFVVANESNHKLVFYLLETFNNLLQYQVAGNTALIYAIIRHSSKFYDLRDLTFDKAVAELDRIRTLRARKHNEQQDQQPVTASSKPDAESETGASGTATPEETEQNTEPQRPPMERRLSEKAKGKLPANAAPPTPIAPTGPSDQKFVPIPEWFNYWHVHLPLQTLLILLDALSPTVESMIQSQSITDDKPIIDFLNSGTLVGLLPLPHPISVRRWHGGEATRVWITSYIWGAIFERSVKEREVGSVWMGKSFGDILLKFCRKVTHYAWLQAPA
ncbi:high-temperature-induced dauer-formation protein-domain-containing protein [Gaertneriomyces semiglobifer]|nr:high-temperature-induced dauer-formation protein-domain-containing protein [Gaertneriomyces semiglobifer]